MKPVRVDAARCVGCRQCELACSFSRFGEFNPSKAAIRITFCDDGRLAAVVDDTCTGCRPPPCVSACPVGAIAAC